MPYVYSTATNSIIFNVFGQKPNEETPPPVLKKIHIKGGANVALRDIATGGVNTFAGFKTHVTDEELELLNQDKNFQKGLELGHFAVTDHLEKVSKVVKDLKPKDGSAPKVLNDFPKNDDGKPFNDNGLSNVTVASVGNKTIK